MNRPIILIPSYNPDHTLPETIEVLRGKGFERFVIVNDGSKPECLPIFEQVADMPGVHLLTHAVNMGKGRGMKTAFNYILSRFPGMGCIACDADGQHPADSVVDVAEAMGKYPEAMVLGVRRFSENPDMPRANRMGNQLTRGTFFLLSGMRYADTQCGLRGYPANVMAKIITCRGERFELENTMLMEVRRLGIDIVQVGMPAVYQEEGKYTSHFNKVKDSVRIYKVLLAYAAVPLLAALVSFVLFMAVRLLVPVPAVDIIAAAVGYFVGWLLMVAGIGKKAAGKAWAALLAVTAGGTALFSLLLALLPSAPVGCWWIAAPFTAAASYALWLALREGPLPGNIRLDKEKK